jgi:hypothetical protein
MSAERQSWICECQEEGGGMKGILFVLVLIAGLSVAQDPANILVYYDYYAPTGDAVLTALSNLWPSATVIPCSGYPGGMYTQFNTALDTGAWDMVIVESWYAANTSLNWPGIADYYTGGGKLFVASWSWTGGQQAAATAMGVTAEAQMPNLQPMYVWDSASPIVEGITDWSQTDPGLITKSCSFTVGTAIPVTGWTSSPTPGQAAICVAPDGHSVISGYVPAYSTQNVAIWENILGFMWGEVGLTPATWGDIKSQFGR